MIILKPPIQRIPYWAYFLLLLSLAVNTIYFIARFQILPVGAGSTVEFVMPLTPDLFWSQQSWFYYAMFALIVTVCTTSMYILYRKPYDLSARIFFIYLQLFAIAQNFRFISQGDFFTSFASIAFIVCFNLFGIALVHFHLIFPSPLRFYNRHKRILKSVYLVGSLFGAAMTALFFLRMYGLADHAASAFITFSRWSVAWMGLTLTFALAFSVLQFFNAKNPQVRRQLRLVVIGSAFGLATPIVFSFYPELIWKLEQDRQMYTMLEVANGTGTYIMTSFLAIAIFHYRIWNIEPFIRRAILYGAASVVIYLSYLALIYLVDRLTIPSTNLVHFITLAFSMVAFLFLRDWIQRLIDRVFHRESYDSTNVIEEFEERLTGIYQVDKLISGIEESLNRIFHFKSFIFNMRIAERRYKAVYLTGTNDIALDEEFEVTGEIEELLRKSSIFSTEELMEMPKLFDYSRGELIIPLMDGEKPLGFFIAGPKMSEKSYSLQDIRVLSLLSRRIISLFQTASLYQNDLERQLMLERERYRIAEAMHDDVGASLTRITILSEMAASDCSNPEQTKQWLGKISLASREVVQDMNEIIWALNPKNGTLEELITFLHRFAFEYLGPTPVSCLFNLPEDLPVKMLSVQSRRNVYLSVKESLNNIVKHASAKKAEILVTINQDMLMISIKDDGTGFDPEKLDHPGNGLPNMMKRMEEIGGEFNLNSKTGQGTKTLLIAPLK